MILVKQDMWIIRFEHEKGFFRSGQGRLYELNLTSLSLDQAQNVSKIEILPYKDF